MDTRHAARSQARSQRPPLPETSEREATPDPQPTPLESQHTPEMPGMWPKAPARGGGKTTGSVGLDPTHILHSKCTRKPQIEAPITRFWTEDTRKCSRHSLLYTARIRLQNLFE
uniref:Uncharacterized protein n=1 Tax=Coccidioides posadasii RMSCC 3488 TaxID=454284 RepID=A0A0J6F702_COCPO|nr:hypothetical protein CPAG_05055 [Coccidioides posadasii RMSCC 3488]